MPSGYGQAYIHRHNNTTAPAQGAAETLGQTEANTLPDPTQQQLQAAREEAELTLEQLHLVQEELEVYFLKAEELSESLQQRDAQISEKDTQLNQLRQELEHARGYIPKSEELTQALQQRDAQISEKDTQLNQLRQELEQANQNALVADSRTDELQKLLTTAQKMLEGQATYLQDLSKKEEEAELAIERERQFTAEIVYLFENSRIAPGLDSSRIPRLRDLLQIKQRNTNRSH